MCHPSGGSSGPETSSCGARRERRRELECRRNASPKRRGGSRISDRAERDTKAGEVLEGRAARTRRHQQHIDAFVMLDAASPTARAERCLNGSTHLPNQGGGPRSPTHAGRWVRPHSPRRRARSGSHGSSIARPSVALCSPPLPARDGLADCSVDLRPARADSNDWTSADNDEKRHRAASAQGDHRQH